MRLKRNRDKVEEETFCDFLAAICQKVMVDPSLADFFVELPTTTRTETSLAPTNIRDGTNQGFFPLLEGLLELISSEKEHVVRQACEGILVCLALPSSSTTNLIVYGSQTCRILVRSGYGC